MNSPKKKILCISPFFVPLSDSEAVCGAKVVRELVARGLEVRVVSLHDQDSERKEDSSSFWIDMHGITTRVPYNSGKNKWSSMIACVRYQTIGKIGWVDTVIDHAIKLRNVWEFDLVYSRSLPAIAHVAGYWISRMYNIPWIANINDPWELYLFSPSLWPKKRSFLSYVGSKTSNFWMKRTFQSASLIIFPCSRLLDFHLRRVSPKNQCKILPHIGYRKQCVVHDPNFLLVHAGRLGNEPSRRHSAITLLNALGAFLKRWPAAVVETRLVLVGPRENEIDKAIKALGLERNTSCTGLVSYETSLDFIASAAVCLLVEGRILEGIFLPSKLVDYIVSRKPILALSPRIGTVADFGENTRIVRVDGDDEKAILTAIERFYKAYKTGDLNRFSPPENFAKKFEGPRIAEQFSQCISEVSHPKRR